MDSCTKWYFSKPKIRCLVVRGISQQQANIPEIKKICQEVLKTERYQNMKSVKTLYRKKDEVVVLVEFGTAEDVEDILMKTRNLKGTNIYIERDLNAERSKIKYGYELFALVETHVRENEFENWDKYFKEFNLVWQTAERTSRYGRASGGVVCGIKKSLQKEGVIHTLKIQNGINMIQIDSPRCGFTFIPTYIRGENWDRGFEKIRETFRNKKDASIILAGDMNVRIGNLQQPLSEVILAEFKPGTEYRRSRDEIVNTKGKQFKEFCDDNGLVVLNGRTVGDEEGHFTYVSHIGSSVNDIAAVSYDALPMIRQFEVIEKTWSDHLPIYIEIEIYKTSSITKSMKLTPKLQWKEARRKSFKYLNKYRKTNALSDKAIYIEAVKEYKSICRERKREYARKLEAQITRTTNTKERWRLATQIRGQDMQIGVNISAYEFKCYFDQLLNQPQIANSIHYAPTYIEDEKLDKDIDLQEIQSVLAKTKPNKAPGIDRITYEFLANATNEFLTELTAIYNKIFSIGEIDNTLEETILNEGQSGFRAGYSTVDNIYNLSAIVNIKLSEKKKVYAFFVDFSATFDMVSRNLLMYKLHALGVSTKILNLIKSLYQKTKSVVWIGEEMSEHFNTYTGVRQGCLLSVLLFTLYINDICDYLDGGINVDELNVRVLLYADDIVLLAEDRTVLQEMIHNLEMYCSQWNMVVNLEKSKIMVFRNGGRIAKEDKWTYLNRDIEVVNEFCYLGVTLTPKMSFTKHVEKRNTSSKLHTNYIFNTIFKYETSRCLEIDNELDRTPTQMRQLCRKERKVLAI
ncbi:uncharacterized protein LOC142224955 [Haematobia irritans]|uniref:uncharacterized protein LOC142224955 n=1 Tax=Haematobia irritans TaxID=7368 RepID=UPI003F4F512D